MKILQIVGSLQIGGQENVSMNIMRYAPEEYSFDYLVYEDDDETGYYREAKTLGANIITIPSFRKDRKNFFNYLNKMMTSENYDVVHSHTFLNSGWIMKIAKNHNIPKRITHIHSQGFLEKSYSLQNLYQRLMIYFINKYSTDLISISQAAGKQIFSNNDFNVINNGINISQYEYNSYFRQKYREEFAISNDQVVLGHIGHISKVKNQTFILNLLKEMPSELNFKLLLIGGVTEQEYMNEILDCIKENQLENRVLVLGERTDVSKILNALDVLVFPSLYEGIPLALIEAQVNGLPIVASDTINKNSDITNTMKFESLESSSSAWVNSILKSSRFEPKIEDLTEYDVKKAMNEIYTIYNTF